MRDLDNNNYKTFLKYVDGHTIYAHYINFLICFDGCDFYDNYNFTFEDEVKINHNKKNKKKKNILQCIQNKIGLSKLND